ncbi:site-specific DNA-methyltransferase, partial [Salmonella enterica subsp. enterica serovar Typhi]|nr:site-specific DNA-methyltransferase [Salmonella enterica subsp. enterica serovar Typhi]
KEAGFFCHQTCIWVKNAPVLNRYDYLYAHEPVLYGWKPTSGHKFYGDRKQRTVWNFDRPTSSKLHPTMKPLNLLAYPIKNSSLTNCIVLDPFGGSGSTFYLLIRLRIQASLIVLYLIHLEVLVVH